MVMDRVFKKIVFSLHFHFAFFYTTKSSLLLLDEDVKWTDKCEHYVIGCVELKLRWEFIKENKKVRKKVIIKKSHLWEEVDYSNAHPACKNIKH